MTKKSTLEFGLEDWAGMKGLNCAIMGRRGGQRR